MAQPQEQQAKSSYAIAEQHNLRAAQTKSRQRTLAPFQSSNTLTEQCNTCLKNLRVTIKGAQYAAANQVDSFRTILHAIERRLDEHRLRLDIWRSDCHVEEGGLSAITIDEEPNLLRLLSESFSQLHEQITVISGGIDQIGKAFMPSDKSLMGTR